MSGKKPLRESLKELLEQDGLSASQIERLQQRSKQARKTSRLFGLPGISLAAAAVLCVLSFNIYWLSYQHDGVQARIVNEILTNHLNDKPLDLTTDSIEDINRFFVRLDFSPFLSTRINTAGLKPLGGRYCTLQGVIALQLRLVTADGRTVTYYQSRFDKRYFGELPDIEKGAEPGVVYERGVKLSIWRERGVVNALAQPVEV